MHNRFTDNSNALSLRIKRTTYKHCRTCGYRLEGVPKFLQAHYKRYHSGQEPAWLGYGEQPAEGCYSNFEAYLANPDIELEVMPHIRHAKGGRLPPPRPPIFAISRAVAQIMEPPAMSDMESYFFKRSAIDFEMASSWADLQPDGHESRQVEQE